MRVLLGRRVRVADQSAAHALRQLRGDGTPVVMHPTIPAGQPGLAMVNVPFVFDPALNGLQPNPHFQPAVGDAVAKYAPLRARARLRKVVTTRTLLSCCLPTLHRSVVCWGWAALPH